MNQSSPVPLCCSRKKGPAVYVCVSGQSTNLNIAFPKYSGIYNSSILALVQVGAAELLSHRTWDLALVEFIVNDH